MLVRLVFWVLEPAAWPCRWFLNWAVGVIWWCSSCPVVCPAPLWNGNFINVSRVTSGCWRRISRICRTVQESVVLPSMGLTLFKLYPISVMWSILRILEKGSIVHVGPALTWNSRCITVASCKAWSDSLHAWDMTWILWTVSKSVTDGGVCWCW